MHAPARPKNRPFETIENLPCRVRDIATLRGLGYSFREIGREFGVSAQAVSVTLSRHHRMVKSLRSTAELHGLSARAVNALGRFGIRTRADATRRDVLALLRGERNCGTKTLSEIGRWIAAGDQVVPEPDDQPGTA